MIPLENKFQFSEQQLQDFKKIWESIRRRLDDDNFKGIEVKEIGGYFAWGDHKIWHITTEDCKDWKFGVWLDDLVNKEMYGARACRLCVFAQHKDYIDKFKPSDCSVSADFIIDPEEDGAGGYYSEWQIERWTRIFRFVREQPELAWYRNYHGTDFNTEYVSPATAKKAFEKSQKDLRDFDRKQEEVDRQVFLWADRLMKETGLNYKIQVSGRKYCARFKVFAEDGKREPGTYKLCDEKEWALMEKVIGDCWYKGDMLTLAIENEINIVKNLEEIPDELDAEFSR